MNYTTHLKLSWVIKNMYQNIFVDKKENTVHLWDDEKGYVTFPFRNYAYRKSSNGTYRSIYGDKLEKIYNFNPRLFQLELTAQFSSGKCPISLKLKP